ncbi:SNF2 family N-terminal domain-containing protein [Nemania sp. FL0916]|nr:SNF2 family N-terminal domain-containing protein [Nemania sp. FL0916]
MEPPPAKRQKPSHDPRSESQTIACKPVSPLGPIQDYSIERVYSSGTPTCGSIPSLIIEECEPTCFGTIWFTPDSVEEHVKGGAAPVEVSVSERRLLSRKSTCHVATLSQRDVDILDLLTREGVESEVRLIFSSVGTDDNISPQPKITATLFRRIRLEQAWIDFLQDQKLYLQDPIYTNRNLPYWNPQKFYNEPNAFTLDFRQRLGIDKTSQEVISPADILAEFTSNVVLAETEGSYLLRTPLKIHQKKALTFMVNRERSWNFEQANADIWSSAWAYDSQYHYFVNNVDLTERYEPPPAFKGGILADGMGSGKTLTMISLIAHDRTNGLRKATESLNVIPYQCTLVVMPPHVLHNWDAELLKHLPKKQFSWKRHHGTTKLKDTSEIATVDIVLITYPTLVSEWRRKSSSTIFRHTWHRVILDEAHSIKDSTTISAKAAYALKSDRRWAVTGTPIQNRLSDLASLFQFLQAFPYSNRKTFDEGITRMWSSGQVEQAIERLKRLLNFIMLRRSQDGLNLPERTDLRIILDFDNQERRVYTAAKDKTLRSIDDLISDQSNERYLNALQKINLLRLICNLGSSATEGRRMSPQPPAFPGNMAWNESSAQQTLISLYLAGNPLICVNCTVPIDTFFDGPDDVMRFQFTQCLRIRCPSCYDSFASSGINTCTCGSSCSSVALGRASLPIFSADAEQTPVNGNTPTKVRHLVQDLKKYSPNEKCALEQANIICVQVDGRVKSKQREQIFHDFTHVENIRVLLLSLSCGASGLTLTAASRVYLMEPQWNPATEEQALARVYRIGQTRNVTTVRYIMGDSIEKHVVAVQDDKKDLITLLLSNPSAMSKKATKQRLMSDSQPKAGDDEWKSQPPYLTPDATPGFEKRYSAQCHCGKVKYWLSRAQPLASKFCHCTDCQALHGAPFQWAAIFQKSDLRFAHGASGLAFYHAPSRTVTQQRHELPAKVSCANCRSPIMDEGRNMALVFPGIIHFESGEDKKLFDPQCHIFYGQRVVNLPDGKPKWAGLDNSSELMSDTG